MSRFPKDTPEYYMNEALNEAQFGAAAGEVPIGAVVVVNNKIIARAHNEVEKQTSATKHAEILAIERASKELGNWRLSEASLYVTLEPCSMCIGAMVNARVGKLYFGAYDKRQGAVGSLFDLSDGVLLPHKIEVIPELLAEESESLLTKFFQKLR